MKSTIFAAAVSLVLTAADPLLDEGVSLLQLRVEKHQAEQAWGRSDPFFTDPGQDCEQAGARVLTYTECLMSIRDGISSHNGYDPPYFHVTGGHYNQPGLAGCFMDDSPGRNWRRAYYNPGATTGNVANFKGICAQNGSRRQEQIDKPVFPMPEVELKEVGVRCDEGCGALTLDQCWQVGKDQLINVVEGRYGVHVQVNPGGYGCYKDSRDSQLYYNPYVDLPDSHSWIARDTGNTQDVAEFAKHICVVCPTTTTTTSPSLAPPDVGNVASAVGDPHVTNTAGQHFDLQ